MPPVKPTGSSRGGGCVVPGCDSHVFNKDKTIHFFPFPTETKLRDKWCANIKKSKGAKRIQVGEDSHICHLHFKWMDIRKKSSGIWKLKKGAEPFGAAPPRTRNTCYTETTEKNAALEKELSKTKADKAIIADILKEREAVIEELKAENQQLMEASNALADSIGRLQREVDTAHGKCEPNQFASIVEGSDTLTEHYTGFSSFSLLMETLAFLNPGDRCENLISHMHNTSNATTENQPPKDIEHNYSASPFACQDLESPPADMDHSYSIPNLSVPKYSRPARLSVKEQFILVLCRLWQGFSAEHLGQLFDTSEQTVNNYFLTWINFMYFRLKPLHIWLCKDDVAKTTPKIFMEKYPGTRVIIDCVDILVQAPAQFRSQASQRRYVTQVYRALLGVAPSGAVTFLSHLFPENISDKKILLRSNFLDPRMFSKDDVIIAHRGLPIKELLRHMDVNVKVNDTHCFTRRKEPLVMSSIFSIEHALSRPKQFRIFDRALPLSLHGHMNQIWTVCGILTNLLCSSTQ